MMAGGYFVLSALLCLSIADAEYLKFKANYEDDVKELINFLKKPFLPERFKSSEVLLNAGLDKSKRLTAFHYKNCGGMIDVRSLSVMPDPLQFPGTITFSASGALNATLSAPLNAAVVLKKKAAGIWIPIPCIDQIGSCNYGDICTLLESVTQCPPQLTAIGIDCKCPIKAGKYTLPSMSQDIGAEVFPSGDYQVTGNVTDKAGRVVACLQVELSVAIAIKSLKNGKSAGIDEIPSEALKAGGNEIIEYLYGLLNKIWNQECLPSEWKKGLLVKLAKKGGLSNCENWRGITILTTASKVLSRIILNRIKNALDKILREEQAGFRQNRSCIDQIAILRIIIEQSVEWQSSLYINFIDFEKAFDSINRDRMWKLLQYYGLPVKIVNMIKALYEDFNIQIINYSNLTEPFQVTTGVKQGCILSPTLFWVVIDWVTRQAFDSKRGIQWTIVNNLEDLDFADDLTLLSHRIKDMRDKTRKLYEKGRKIGLKVNIKKTNIMKVMTRKGGTISVEGEDIEEVDQFTYLGSIVSKTGGTEEDINSRIRKGRQTFAMLKPSTQSKLVRRMSSVSSDTRIEKDLFFLSLLLRDMKLLLVVALFVGANAGEYVPETVENEIYLNDESHVRLNDETELLMDLLNLNALPERYRGEDYFKSVGRKKSSRVEAFQWQNCGSNDPATALSLSVTPDPLQFPGTINIAGKLQFNASFPAPLPASLVVSKKAAGIWVKLPCIDSFGSCDYPDLCEILSGAGDCPDPIVSSGLGCQCPFKSGTFDVQGLSFDVDASALPSGDYKLRGSISTGGKEDACVEIVLTIA
ncbi:uncharacterized protein LOC125680151 [Ostrea edulis]|uniref:uncharacterized protein LOC125680151 n=1 Tax=Ostrea edulis TaxID=37623 RepID=UPI0024AE97F1|nr:uncharacterized protein LOC125680151 [Ostrea edulis]